MPSWRAGFAEFRDLFLQLREQESPGRGWELIEPWWDARPHLLHELHDVGRPESRRVRVAPDPQGYTALEGRYALNRVVDVLLAPHQPARRAPDGGDGTDPEPWPVTVTTASAWTAFIAMIGAVPVAEPSFHPFFHEIVRWNALLTPTSRPA